MDTNAVENGTALPAYAQGAGLILLIFILFYSLAKCKEPSSRFLLIVIWSRFVLSAFHNVTFVKILPGLSINSLSSVIVVAVGLIMIKRSSIYNLSTFFMAPYLLFLIASATINGQILSSLDDVIKILYLIIIISHLYKITIREDYVKFSNYVIYSFSPLIIYQALSVILGIRKASEADGSVSYIGGYNHEAAFSVGILGMIVAVALGQGINPLKRIGVLFLGIVGITIANYRTTILASSPLILYVVGSAVLSVLPMRLRGLLLVSGGISALFLMFTIISNSERLADIPAAIELVQSGISSPATITTMQKKLLSGRLYLWSEYIYQWKISSSIHQLFGFGPGSWSKQFAIYAHNTFVNALYEGGIFGLISLLGFFILSFFLALRASYKNRVRLLLAQLSFFILNLATMPMWQVEGLIAFAFIIGWTVAHNTADRSPHIDKHCY